MRRQCAARLASVALASSVVASAQAASSSNRRSEGGPANADKTPRYQAIAAGRTAVSRTPIEILVFVGDNILDFPNASQARRAQGEAGFAEFGVRWFLLPNPMYGSWQ